MTIVAYIPGGTTQTLLTMLLMAGGRKLITHLYPALQADRWFAPLPLEDTWKKVCEEPLLP